MDLTQNESDESIDEGPPEFDEPLFDWLFSDEAGSPSPFEL